MSRTKKTASGSGANTKRRREVEDASNGKKKQQKQNGKAPFSSSSSFASATRTTKQHAEETLSKLLGGMPLSKFLAEHFEKKPLLVRRSDNKKLFANDLFSRKQLLGVLNKHELHYGKDLTICKYVNGARENYDDDKNATSGCVSDLFDQRFSCQFFQPQRYVDGLFTLNAAFETFFGCLAGSSAYLTPPAAQALAPHHDDVEVFILQTQGRKKWKLYKPLVELAGEHSSDLSPDQIGEPWMEMTLEEGDVLYFPRGVVHQACTDEEQFSTHVTISVYQHNSWANFLEVLLPRVIRHAFDSDIDFRRGLPVAYLDFMGTQFPSDSKEAQSFTATCKKLLGKLGDHIHSRDLHQAADEAALDVVANRLPPVAQKKNAGISKLSPLHDGVAVRFQDRSHIRLSMGEDEQKEAFVAVYYSLYNCRLHHMGLCTCCGEDDTEEDEDDEEDDESDAKSNDNDDEDENDEENDDNESDSGDIGDAIGQVPAQPRSIAFPGELAPPLLKMYTSSPAFTPVEKIIEAGSDETAVRGMLLRLWSEGLLDVAKSA